MPSTIVGVIRPRLPERRVSVTPDVAQRLTDSNFEILVEPGAGAASRFSDSDYVAAGAHIVSTEDLDSRADIVTCVESPDTERLSRLRKGQVLIGLMEPWSDPERIASLASSGVTTVSLDGLPRQLSRAQSMDVLSSQASIAGYKAAVVAAGAYERYFPMLTTAAGTSSPATVLVLGTGVAGLSAIGTARRLGAVVTAYDVRPEARDEAESVGARFLKLTSVESAAGAGGYARALTDAEREAQQRELSDHIARFDVVITTAKVPGRRPPVLVNAEALAGMRAGSVVVDMAAGPLGGNVEGSQADTTVELESGVRLIGAGNLASQMAPAASTAYAKNLSALLRHFVGDGEISIDLDDEITAGVVVTHSGNITQAQLRESVAATVGGTP